MNPKDAKKTLALGFLQSGGTLDWQEYESLSTDWRVAFMEAGAEYRESCNADLLTLFMESIGIMLEASGGDGTNGPSEQPEIKADLGNVAGGK